MHESSAAKMRCFRDAYRSRFNPPIRVLDVGSMAQQQQDSYLPLFSSYEYDYVGLDVAAGPNVDFVPEEVYDWTELESESFGMVISGQAFEHNPYPWITMAEIARVLRPGGLMCMIAPSAGMVHRYPLDCWRYYPDAAGALCAYVGLELVESYVEPSEKRVIEGAADWRDFFMVAQRPDDIDTKRLAAIVATRSPFPPPATAIGPAITSYEAAVTVGATKWRTHQLRAGAVGLAASAYGRARHLISRGQ